MGTDKRFGRALWLVPLVAITWISVSAFVSVTLTVWGLAVLCAGAGVARWAAPERSAVAIRQRALDVSLLAVFAFAFVFLAWTGRLG